MGGELEPFEADPSGRPLIVYQRDLEWARALGMTIPIGFPPPVPRMAHFAFLERMLAILEWLRDGDTGCPVCIHPRDPELEVQPHWENCAIESWIEQLKEVLSDER